MQPASCNSCRRSSLLADTMKSPSYFDGTGLKRALAIKCVATSNRSTDSATGVLSYQLIKQVLCYRRNGFEATIRWVVFMTFYRRRRDRPLFPTILPEVCKSSCFWPNRRSCVCLQLPWREDAASYPVIAWATEAFFNAPSLSVPSERLSTSVGVIYRIVCSATARNNCYWWRWSIMTK